MMLRVWKSERFFVSVFTLLEVWEVPKSHWYPGSTSMSKIGLSQKGYYLANLGHFGLFFHIFRFLEAISLCSSYIPFSPDADVAHLNGFSSGASSLLKKLTSTLALQGVLCANGTAIWFVCPVKTCTGKIGLAQDYCNHCFSPLWIFQEECLARACSVFQFWQNIVNSVKCIVYSGSCRLTGVWLGNT